jgi:hypothetical protein
MGGGGESMYYIAAKTRGGRAQTLVWVVDRDGRFASAPDTVALEIAVDAFWQFNPTRDGWLAYSHGPDERALWALPMDQALAGRFDFGKRRVRSTGYVHGALSPDGRWILVARPGYGPDMRRLSVVPFEGGAEIVVGEGAISHQTWTRDGSVVFTEASPSGARVIEVRIPSRQRRELGTLADQAVTDLEVLADGRVLWVPDDHRPVKLGRPGETPRAFSSPPWLASMMDVNASADGGRAVVTGYAAGFDTVVVATLRLDDGTWTPVWRGRAEGGSAKWLHDGSLLLVVRPTRQTTELYRLPPGGRVQRMGGLAGLTVGADASLDGRSILVTTSEYRGDVWIARLGEPR